MEPPGQVQCDAWRHRDCEAGHAARRRHRHRPGEAQPRRPGEVQGGDHELTQHKRPQTSKWFLSIINFKVIVSL